MENLPIPSRTADPSWEIKASSTHGRGLFARQHIPAGSHILEYTGKRIPIDTVEPREDGRVYTVAIDDDWAINGDCPKNPARFANHACSPNCELELIEGRLILWALTDISQGKEILFDYGWGLEGLFQLRCRCQTAGCIGYIVGEPYRPQARRLIAQMRRRR